MRLRLWPGRDWSFESSHRLDNCSQSIRLSLSNCALKQSLKSFSRAISDGELRWVTQMSALKLEKKVFRASAVKNPPWKVSFRMFYGAPVPRGRESDFSGFKARFADKLLRNFNGNSSF
jgi:hypothetical protein